MLGAFTCQLLHAGRGLNAAVRVVPMGAENTSPYDAVYASWQPRVSASYGIFHLQTGMYVNRYRILCF